MALELPWIIKTFGDIKNVNVLTDKISDLKIEYNDNYMIQIEHTNGNKGSFIVDIVSPVAVRKLEIYTEGKYIQWNGTPDSLMEYDTIVDQLKYVVLNEKEEHKEGYRAFVIEDAYKNEIEEFFDVVLKGKKQMYSFTEDLEILNFIEKLGA